MTKRGIAYIDVYKSTFLKEGKPQGEIEQAFNAYRLLVEKTSSEFGGEIWRRMGESNICIFPTSAKAVDACIQLLESLVEFKVLSLNCLDEHLGPEAETDARFQLTGLRTRLERDRKATQ